MVEIKPGGGKTQLWNEETLRVDRCLSWWGPEKSGWEPGSGFDSRVNMVPHPAPVLQCRLRQSHDFSHQQKHHQSLCCQRHDAGMQISKILPFEIVVRNAKYESILFYHFSCICSLGFKSVLSTAWQWDSKWKKTQGFWRVPWEKPQGEL